MAVSVFVFLFSAASALAGPAQTNLRGWWTAKDLSTFTFVSSNRILSWANKAIAGGTLTRGTPGDEPTRNDDGFLGSALPYVWFPYEVGRFYELDGNVPSNNYVTPDAATIYIVGYDHSNPFWAGDPMSPEQGGALTLHEFKITTPGNLTAKYSTVVAATPLPSGDAKLHVWKVVHAGGNLSVSVDGGTPVTVPSVSMGAIISGPILGYNPQVSPFGQFNGAICELLLYNAPLSASDDQQTMNYLRTQWNIPFSSALPNLSWLGAGSLMMLLICSGAVLIFRSRMRSDAWVA